MIEIKDSIDREKWDEFVFNHPKGNIFQTSYMADVYSSTKNYEPISLAAVDSESLEIMAVTLAVIIRDATGLIGSISSRSIINGGPIFIEDKKGFEAVTQLLNYYEQVLQNRAIYTQMRNVWNMENARNTLEPLGYQYEPHLNYLINLDRSIEDIWKDIHKPRRKGINRAEKIGIQIRKIEDKTEIKDCYRQIEETYKNVRLPLADISLLESVYEKFVGTGFVDFYLANLDGEVVGSRVVLKYKGMVHDWYAGSKQEINYVNEAVVWHMLREYAGKEKVFDFGGAGHPDKPYGVREFKKRFGGEEVNYGRYKKVHNKSREEIMKSGLKIYKTVGKYMNIKA
ncbi:peptidoglycan bridge formation glycyltransferase FemA/FemB family protein [Methanosarcina sp. KYL-1]|uniref:lipid II:glycine glycyltransferase FemX n=1 Tax=Methanosarcina sp. KYL-1 TaxID=2602068 RepID=UPI0021014ECB|nr:GNAT family N-acetyltransferase [Methanosarcina sp. KYL-1]MCQ1535498.1 peptidoglycan bridge formation glycyltransferase FemA/FemB family protein [Methanosarcina sp. KYL-1]